MSKRFRRGLVVGKFSPLHRGHELLLARAQAACEELLILSYSKPDYPGCERERRARWLAELFPHADCIVLDDAELGRLCIANGESVRALPHNDAPAAVHREFVGWICLALRGMTVDAVFTSETYGDGFAADLGAQFRRLGHAGTHVAHVCVDLARGEVPICGSTVRADIHGRRSFLSPSVYADFVERVCLLGGESSGKTTLAQALAEHLDTVWVPEYGRELWVRLEGRLTFDHMLQIAQTQVDREREASMRAHRWLICDTSPLTTLFYSLDGFGRSDPRLDALAARRYDHVFLCEPDFDFVQDGSRRDDAFRKHQHAWYRRELARRHIPYRLIAGPPAHRLRTASNCL